MGKIKEFVRIGRMDRIGNRKSSELSHPVHPAYPDRFFVYPKNRKRCYLGAAEEQEELEGVFEKISIKGDRLWQEVKDTKIS